jgi:hypothetical protein
MTDDKKGKDVTIICPPATLKIGATPEPPKKEAQNGSNK